MSTYSESTKREIDKSKTFRHVTGGTTDATSGITCKIRTLFMPSLCVLGNVIRRMYV